MRKVKQNRGGISLTTTVVIIAAVVAIVMCATKLRDVKIQTERLQAEAKQLAAEEEALKTRIRTLQGYNDDGYDADYVEAMARQNLDMVYPGEIIFKTEE